MQTENFHPKMWQLQKETKTETETKLVRQYFSYYLMPDSDRRSETLLWAEIH